MLKLIPLGIALVLSAAPSAAEAATPSGASPRGLIKISEGCGTGWWRGPTGHCHPFNSAGGSPRGTHFACPPGMHVGAGGRRCWPNPA